MSSYFTYARQLNVKYLENSCVIDKLHAHYTCSDPVITYKL